MIVQILSKKNDCTNIITQTTMHRQLGKKQYNDKIVKFILITIILINFNIVL